VKLTARTAVALLFSLSLLLAAVLAPASAHAQGPLAPPAIYLVTVAPGGALFSLYGHAALCVETVGQPEATCYDYGVAQAESDRALLWGALRGKKVFVPVKVPQSVMMGFFRDEERAMWKQTLPLAPDEARHLQSRLESAALAREGYAYHPAFSNCTTQLRDLIEDASPGKLRSGADVVPPGPSFRELCEQGLSGKAIELAFVSMVLGGDAEQHPTEWQLMFLPSQLRDRVERKFGVKPEKIFEPHEGNTLATSPSAGRFALGLLGFVLLGAIVYASRSRATPPSPARWRRTLAAVGIILGALGLLVWGVAATTTFSELQRNWVLVVLVPFDVLLGFLGESRLRRYVEVRLVVLLVVLVLALVHVIAQPLGASVALAGLPLAAVYGRLRRKEIALLVRRGPRGQVLLQQK
jgi:Domain of unknown function (DUF4105)